jgi:hypothetical protein
MNLGGGGGQSMQETWEDWALKFVEAIQKVIEKDLTDKVVKATLPIYERESMLQYPSETESTQLLSVDEPIQKELEYNDQEIEAANAVSEYQEQKMYSMIVLLRMKLMKRSYLCRWWQQANQLRMQIYQHGHDWYQHHWLRVYRIGSNQDWQYQHNQVRTYPVADRRRKYRYYQMMIDRRLAEEA